MFFGGEGSIVMKQVELPKGWKFINERVERTPVQNDECLSTDDTLRALDDACRKMDVLARELDCLGFFGDTTDEGPKAA